MTLWVLSTQWLAVVHTQPTKEGAGRWAGWYNRQYPDLGRVDMSYELWVLVLGGWRVPVSPQPLSWPWYHPV